VRRGLISWSRDEVPPSVLEGRVARLQEQMRAAELGVVLIYTSFARPSAVAWLTHFVPYWNEALLVVFPTGAPVLLKERPPGPSRVGVLELDALPWRVAEHILKPEHGGLVDVTALFASIRQPADEAEIRLAQRAANITAQALGAI